MNVSQVFFLPKQFCINDPSKTFWDDPNMYVDDPGLDTLLSLTTDELLLCNSENATVAETNSDQDGNPLNEQRDKMNDGKQVLVCMYPNCDKTYLKPSHLKVGLTIFFFYSGIDKLCWS